MGHKNWHRNHNPVGRSVACGETEGKRNRRKAKRLKEKRRRQRRFKRELRKTMRVAESIAEADEELREIADMYGWRAYRSCLSKRYYASEEYAEAWARYYTERYGDETSVYKCDYCDGWHLTTCHKEKS